MNGYQRTPNNSATPSSAPVAKQDIGTTVTLEDCAKITLQRCIESLQSSNDPWDKILVALMEYQVNAPSVAIR
jgi:hypothetical protein